MLLVVNILVTNPCDIAHECTNIQNGNLRIFMYMSCCRKGHLYKTHTIKRLHIFEAYFLHSVPWYCTCMHGWLDIGIFRNVILYSNPHNYMIITTSIATSYNYIWHPIMELYTVACEDGIWKSKSLSSWTHKGKTNTSLQLINSWRWFPSLIVVSCNWLHVMIRMLFTKSIDKCYYMSLMDERKKLSPWNNPGPNLD